MKVQANKIRPASKQCRNWIRGYVSASRFLPALLLTLVLSVWNSNQGLCQPFPTRTITLVHAYQGGGLGLDLGQLVAARLEKELRWPAIVETRPGGNSLIAAMSVIRSAPDGHTLLINSMSIMGMSRAIHATPAYDPITDFVPVALLASVPMVLVTNAQLPIRSLQDLATLARSRAGGLSFGTLGVGSSQHLILEFIKRTFGIEFTHVPYRGVSLGLNDVAGGHIALMIADIATALPLIEAGKLRPIGVTTAKRAELLGVPPLSEIGLAGLDVGVRMALYAPAKTPIRTIGLLNSTIHEIGKDAVSRKRFADQGIELIATPGPDELTTIHASDVARWSKLVQDAGLAGSQ